MNKYFAGIINPSKKVLSQGKSTWENIEIVLFNLFKTKFDTFFRLIGGVFLIALIYEILAKFIFPYYTFGRVCTIFGMISLIYIWKGLLEKKPLFLMGRQYISNNIEEFFYGYMIFGMVLLFASLYFPSIDEILPFVFIGGIIVFAIFKYFGKQIEFAKADIFSQLSENIKKGIIFLCFSTIVFIPFLYTTQLYQYKGGVLFFLMLIEIILIVFLVIDRNTLKRKKDWRYTLKQIFKRS